MKTNPIKIPAKDGYLLSAIVKEPDTTPKGVIQINSGTGVLQKLYANFASFLTESGYITVTFDYRGIGESAPTSLKDFDASMADWGKKDITGIFDWIVEKYPDQKKILVGHSIGGQLFGMMDNYAKIDKIILIGASTGYWKDLSKPHRFMLPLLWYGFVPLSAKIYGYINSKLIKQGENLPKRVGLEWRDWCTSANYFEKYFDKKLQPIYYEKITAPIKAFQILDDYIANDITVPKLLAFYKNAPVTYEKIYPNDLGVNKIGHFGYFSRKFRDSLWTNLLADL